MPVTSIRDRVVPQANRLDVVSAVVDAIADGCTSASEIADAVAMSGRQGSYYPHAAAALGLVYEVAGSFPMEWQLTELGATFVGLDAEARVEVLTDAVWELDDVEIWSAPDGAARLAAEWASSGLAADTVARRLTCLEAWVRFVDTPADVQVKALAAAMSGTRDRAPGVRAAAVAARAARYAAPTRRVCEHCSLVIPVALKSCEDCT